MAGDVRGHDLESWLTNRATYREGVTAAVDRLRAASEGFLHASDGAQPVAESSAAVSNPVELGQGLLFTVNSLKQQLGRLEAERQQARSGFAREDAAIREECRRRGQTEREEAARRARETAERLGKGQVLAQKLAATVIFAIVLYVLAYY